MSDFLPHYQKVDPTTWVYLSSLLIIGLFFKFNRFWSVRNLDLVLLILLAPGLILTQKGYHQLLSRPPIPEITDEQPPSVPEAELSSNVADSSGEAGTEGTVPDDGPPSESARSVAKNGDNTPKPLPDDVTQSLRLVRLGFLWLLGVSLLWLIRLLCDPTMVRRPLLEPNLSMGGLLFIGFWLYLFLMANVLTGTTDRVELELEGAIGAKHLLADVTGVKAPPGAVDPNRAPIATLSEKPLEPQDEVNHYREHGPGYYLLHALPRIATISLSRGPYEEGTTLVSTAKVMAVVSQLAILLGMIVVGYWHFENMRMGVGAAVLYLILPYTAQHTGHVDHALPAALVLWAVVFYRHPLYSGMILGLGMGTSYFALYLLPLWISFYWHRGLMRFLSGVLVSLGVLTGVLAITSDSGTIFWQKFQAMFGLWSMAFEGLRGIWFHRFGWDPWYRVPILITFVILSGFFAAWPAQKNLGTLLSCSAAIMVAAQFWHGYGGGTFIAWYMPLALLTVFRPNLEDRIALTVLGEGWFPRSRLLRRNRLDRAA
jgi:hypothetical protein